MAVYQGARPRTFVLPRRPGVDPAPTLRRRRLRGTVRAGRRSGRLGLVLGGIVVAFLLAFFSLAQDVRVSATSYDMNRLRTDHDRLVGREQDLVSDLNRLGRQPAIRKQALDAGLGQLGGPIILPAGR
ncbi:MAG: hypothetical protein ACJ761_06655 [Chloroflexota bacterium]